VWEIRVSLGRDPLTGSYRQVSRTVHGDKRKAQEGIARIVAAAADGRHRGTKATVGFLLDRGWITSSGSGAPPRPSRSTGA
jgi:hypothetical protein